MRADLLDRNPVQLEKAICGCERYEVDGSEPGVRQTICLHDAKCTKKSVTRKWNAKAKEFRRVSR
jgi:hypothetical protein